MRFYDGRFESTFNGMERRSMATYSSPNNDKIVVKRLRHSVLLVSFKIARSVDLRSDGFAPNAFTLTILQRSRAF
jgi:hypothetical protein